jgi:hypothetical protein
MLNFKCGFAQLDTPKERSSAFHRRRRLVPQLFVSGIAFSLGRPLRDRPRSASTPALLEGAL